MAYFALKNKRNDKTEMIRFLNSKARDFYNCNHKFEFKQYSSFFKTNLLTGLIDLERVIKGTFGCDIFMKYANIDDLNIMFPNATKEIFKLENEDSLKQMGRMLEILRNMNAHAYLCDRDFEFFNFDFSCLKNQTRFNNEIKYFDKEITIAGVIFIVLNFLREESINTLIKKDDIFSLIACGKISKKSNGRFVAEISGVDLEQEIRKCHYQDLPSSIIGDYSKYNSGNLNQFNVEIGNHRFPTFKVSGLVDGNKVKIFAGSLTKTYYKNDYTLEICDMDSFIELSNEMPPFALIDFLYSNGVNMFGKDTKLACNLELAKKLNKPKFYTDKNIYILSLPSTVSDYRLVSSIVSDVVTKITLELEEYIYKTRGIKRRGNISSIGLALTHLKLSSKCIDDIKYIRNFSTHGYALSDCLIYGDNVKQFTLDYVIDSFKALFDELKVNAFDIYKYTGTLICSYFVNVLVSAKYKLGIMLGREILKDYPYFNKKDMAVKNGFINNSSLDIEKLDKLLNDVNYYNRVIKLVIGDGDEVIFLNDNAQDLMSLEEFLSRNHFKKELSYSSGLLKEYKIIK